MRDNMAPLKGDEGFTLAEVMVAIIILTVIVLATFNILDVHIKEGSVVAMKADLGQELRETSDIMVDQLRTARTFTDASAGSVTFEGYVTGGADTQTVTFYLSNDIVYYSNPDLFPTGDKVLAQDVSALDFTYYDSTGTELTNPGASLDDITMIEIELGISLTYSDITLGDTATTMVRIRR